MEIRHTLRCTLLGAGVMIGSTLLPSAQAQEKPPADGQPKSDRPEGGRRQRPDSGRSQGGRPEGMRPGGGDPTASMDRYQQSIMDLNLTDEQKTKLTEAFTKTKKEMEDLKAVIGSTLNEEQKQSLASRMTGGGGPGGPGGPGGGGGFTRPGSTGGTPGQGRPGQAGGQPAGQPGQAGRPGGSAGFLGMMKQGVEQLGLSDEQKPKVEAIFKEADEKMQAAMKDGGGNREGMREKMMPMMQEIQEKVGAVLTAEQKTKWEEQRAEARKRFQGQGQGRPGGARPDGAGKPDEPKKE